jgi:hypothetical protein
VTIRQRSISFNLKAAVWVALTAVSISACRSHGIDLTVQNNGRDTLRNVEVDYPGAAFGIASLAPGVSYAYRMKPMSTGELIVSFELQNGKSFKQKGPTVRVGENTQMVLVLQQDETHQWQIRAEQK